MNLTRRRFLQRLAASTALLPATKALLPLVEEAGRLSSLEPVAHYPWQFVTNPRRPFVLYEGFKRRLAEDGVDFIGNDTIKVALFTGAPADE